VTAHLEINIKKNTKKWKKVPKMPKKTRGYFQEFTSWLLAVGRTSTVLDLAMELEHRELYEAATDTYLTFHLWLNQVPDRIKKGRFGLEFIGSGDIK